MRIVSGYGNAWFNDDSTKRYLIERKWGTGEKALGAILMNPSHADEVKNDATIELLINYARNNHFDALCVVNIIPIIDPNSKNLSDAAVISEAVKDSEQKEAFKYMLEKSAEVYVGWVAKEINISAIYSKVVMQEI